jgi:hypothetical protein
MIGTKIRNLNRDYTERERTGITQIWSDDADDFLDCAGKIQIS